MKPIRFGPHALAKFDDLRRYNVVVTREQIEDAVQHADRREIGKKGRMVATRRFTEHLVLRVIYRDAEDALEIVTFYPARRSRYENPLRQG